MFYAVKNSCCGPSARSAWRSLAESETDHNIPVDVLEGPEGRFVVRASLPGFRREDVSVAFEDGILTISAKRREDVPVGDVSPNYLVQERAQGNFSRRVRITRASAEGIQAELKDGVLTIVLRREEEAKPRSIPIE